MKSISWQSVANRKFARMFFTIAVVLFWTACSDSSQNVSPSTSAGAKGSSKSTSNFGDYNVALSVSTDGATWTYTITKNAGAKNLSHFIVNLDNCGEESATFDDILWATLNGQPVVFTDSEGKGTGCDPQSLTSNFVKFDNLGAASSYVIVVKFDRGYQTTNTTGWLKAGTSCNSGTIQGPGCPIQLVYCSMSQGYYFAKGSMTNGADSVWTAMGGATVGGNNYTHLEGRALWDSNTAHKRGVIKAFFQYSTIQLSGTDLSADANLAAAMATIEAYYTGKPKITTSNLSALAGVFPDDSAVSAAGGYIGGWVDAHHCTN